LGFNDADLGGAVEERDRFGRALAAGDFDGDGFDELVVRFGHRSFFGGNGGAGALRVVPGSAEGPVLPGAMLVDRDALHGLGSNRAGSGFGTAVATGDINGDGLDDLVIGERQRSGGDGLTSAGVAHVVYGSEAGLDLASVQTISQGSSGLGSVEAGDRFGHAVAVGDFDGDGFDDVALGVPGEDVAGNSIEDAGSVAVVFGSAGGIDPGRGERFSQRGAIAGKAERGDSFGEVLAAGDFNGDGVDDLAVGVPREDVGAESSAGVVNVIYGSSGAGLIVGGNISLSQKGPIAGASEQSDEFGYSLAAGDANGDGFDDLAIGIRGETVGHPRGDTGENQEVGAGAVVVAYGSATGLHEDLTTSFNRRGPIPGVARSGDWFGYSVLFGDLNNDGHDDLVVGAPDIGDAPFTGGPSAGGDVLVLFGAPEGVSEEGSVKYDQGGPVPGTPEPGDLFGSSLAIGDLYGDGAGDLTIGIRNETLNSNEDAGAVAIIPNHP
jgi:hypothetical protein